MSLGSFISSIFTPPGTAAAQNQQNQFQQAGNDVMGLLPQATNYASELQGFQQSQLPTQENAVNGLAQFTTQTGRNALARYNQQYNTGVGQSEAAGASSRFGGNSALAQAYAQNAMNNANTASAAYNAQINSPQGQEQAYQSYLQGAGYLQPNYNSVAGLAGTVYGQPKAPVGQGLGSYLGNMLSSWASGGG
jgi:hypothetical protein